MKIKFPSKVQLKKTILSFWLLAIFLGVAILFWENEWKYNLPTPVPAGYKAVNPGDIISIDFKPKWDNWHFYGTIHLSNARDV